MGMYTEIFVNLDLKKETPQEVINVLKAMCDMDDGAECLKDKPQRWSYLFNDGSFYTPMTSCRRLIYHESLGQYSLIGKGDIKNYGGEIQEFFEFIKPWCANSDAFIGYYRYEEDREPTLVYSDKFEMTEDE